MMNWCVFAESTLAFIGFVFGCLAAAAASTWNDGVALRSRTAHLPLVFGVGLALACALSVAASIAIECPARPISCAVEEGKR